MKYILDEDELNALVNKKKEEEKKNDALLLDLCRRVCNSEPITWTWGKGKDIPMPWRCILEEDDWYCDECPVQDHCPHPDKSWSK